MTLRRVLLALAALAAGATAPAQTVESVSLLPSHGGAQLPVLFGRDASVPPRVAAVLFNGGQGVVGLQKRIPAPGANFLVRTRSEFNRLGVATAVIDVPTDQTGMNDPYRMSERHAEDVRRVVAALRKQHPGLPVYLIGTSRGTVSAAYVGAALGAAVDGVVLTSSVITANRANPGLVGFDWRRITSRLLFVHHVDDACNVTAYTELRRATPGQQLISVRGGEPARSEPCEAFSAHGYLGVEGPVVQAIVQWMLGQPVPADLP